MVWMSGEGMWMQIVATAMNPNCMLCPNIAQVPQNRGGGRAGYFEIQVYPHLTMHYIFLFDKRLSKQVFESQLNTFCLYFYMGKKLIFSDKDTVVKEKNIPKW